MVLTDLYLSAESGPVPQAGGGSLPGIEFAGRCGTRTPLVQGWRAWLARALGRADLAEAAPARVAAAVLGSGPQPSPAAQSLWLASPVHLSAGLSQVHLDHRGLLRLPAAELATLAGSFARAFAASGCALHPLPCGQFLLEAPGIAVVATSEPARCAGGEIAPALPRGAAAAGLRRLAAEIEMWLHAEVGGAASLGERPVNALWLWGAAGHAAGLARAPLAQTCGYGVDPFLDGLWHLAHCTSRPLSETLAPLLTEAGAARAVLALQVSEALRESPQASFAQALRSLDDRFISPALAALRRGTLARVTLVANDCALEVRGADRFRFWRRARRGLAAFT